MREVILEFYKRLLLILLKLRGLLSGKRGLIHTQSWSMVCEDMGSSSVKPCPEETCSIPTVAHHSIPGLLWVQTS